MKNKNIKTTDTYAIRNDKRKSLYISINEDFIASLAKEYPRPKSIKKIDYSVFDELNHNAYAKRGQLFTSMTRAEIADFKLRILISVLESLGLYRADKKGLNIFSQGKENKVNTSYINETTRNNHCFSTFNQTLINDLFSQKNGQNKRYILKSLPALYFDEETSLLILKYAEIVRYNTLNTLRSIEVKKAPNQRT